jgi:hypothetical protein
MQGKERGGPDPRNGKPIQRTPQNDVASARAYNYGSQSTLQSLLEELRSSGYATPENVYDDGSSFGPPSPLDSALNAGIGQAGQEAGNRMAQQSRGSFQDGIRLEALMAKLMEMQGGGGAGMMPGR